jgi:hypothetical protein
MFCSKFSTFSADYGWALHILISNLEHLLLLIQRLLKVLIYHSFLQLMLLCCAGTFLIG